MFEFSIPEVTLSPLHSAIEHYEIEVLRQLLQAGADPNEPDPDFGTRPLQLSVDIECEDACRREDAGDEDWKPHATLTAVLLLHGASPDLPDAKGETARLWAQRRRHEEAVKLFDAQGAAADLDESSTRPTPR